MFMTVTGKLSWQRLRWSAVDFYSKTKKSLFEPRFRGLKGNIRTPSIARWKAHGRLYMRHNWTFFAISYSLRRYTGKRKSVEVGVFQRGWVTLSADFGGKGTSPTNHSWCQSSRVIAVSCGIKISAVRHLDLSESTRVIDGRLDGQTELWLPRLPSHMLTQ